MIFRQLFDSVSGTYTYLLASRRGGEALIIDPVIEKVERYVQLITELDLKLLKLPEETLVFPAHDYKGETSSTIGEEKAFNPRLQVKSMDAYVELMNKLNLPNPKMMDVAVPANMKVGFAQEAIAQRGWAVNAADAIKLIGRTDVTLVDLREKSEREKYGVIPGSLHAPYPDLQDNIQPGGMLHELATATGKRILFYCA